LHSIYLFVLHFEHVSILKALVQIFFMGDLVFSAVDWSVVAVEMVGSEPNETENRENIIFSHTYYVFSKKYEKIKYSFFGL
jgi:hypothetical protein